MEATERERVRFWNAYCRWLAFNFPTVRPDLQAQSRQDCDTILGAFANYVRLGGVSRKQRQVRAQTVQVALRAISTTIDLAGKRNPVCQQKGVYSKTLSRIIEGFKRQDPPSQPKLAIPVILVQYLVFHNQFRGARQKAIADLCLIAFYYLLRVGEYTYHHPSQRRRTKQFRVCDVRFWSGNRTIDPRLYTIEQLYLLCTACTLNISNQKNGKRNQVIHQEALHNDFCPIRALIRRIKHILDHDKNPNVMIGTVYTANGPNGIQAREITSAVRTGIRLLGLTLQGISEADGSSHSLRAGGAMAMHLNGASDNSIKKMGRWSSDTFLMYIHEQIAAFSRGISSLMSNHIPFQNVAFTAAPGPTVCATA